MTTVVRRVSYVHGKENGRDTLEQRFQFNGRGADAAAITEILLSAPLVGESSVFGHRPGEESSGATNRG